MVNSLVLKFPQSLPQVDLKKGPGQNHAEMQILCLLCAKIVQIVTL